MEMLTSESLKEIWRGSFALIYKEKPRLYSAITENDVFFTVNDRSAAIAFYVKNQAHVDWIEKNIIETFIADFRRLSGLDSVVIDILVEDDRPF